MLSQLNRKNNINVELLDLIQKSDNSFLMRSKDADGVPYLQHIFKLYEQLFGQPCQGCPGEIPNYIQRIKNYKIQNLMETTKKAPQKFTLNKGVVVPVPGTSEAYTEHNITDEKAIELLVANPNRKALFRTMPDNIDELIKKGLPKTAAKDSDDDDKVAIGDHSFDVETAKTLLKAAGIKTGASTAKGLTAKVAETKGAELRTLVAAANSYVAGLAVEQPQEVAAADTTAAEAEPSQTDSYENDKAGE